MWCSHYEEILASANLLGFDGSGKGRKKWPGGRGGRMWLDFVVEQDEALRQQMSPVAQLQW